MHRLLSFDCTSSYLCFDVASYLIINIRYDFSILYDFRVINSEEKHRDIIDVKFVFRFFNIQILKSQAFIITRNLLYLI